MDCLLLGVLVLLCCLSPVAAQDARPSDSVTPAEQYLAIAKEFNSEGYALRQAKTDEDREQVVVRVEKLTQRLMELADKNPGDPVATDALVQVITQEIWMENNTAHAGCGQDSPEVRAITMLLRDHVRSDKVGEACRRMSYGFRKECETFLRKASEINPHRDARAAGRPAVGSVPERPFAAARTARGAAGVS